MLYLGDTSLNTAACYLAGVLHYAGYEFRYLPSDQALQRVDLAEVEDLLILSDYPAARIPPSLQRELVQRHESGMSLLMIGGWESYHGLGGDWDQTPLGKLLPVEISTQDDRQNVDGAAVLCATAPQHPILRNLPWSTRPPLIGGYNKVRAKAESQTLLEVVRHSLAWTGQELTFQRTGADPLLVVQETPTGRCACLMTDLAPHWVGPLVDWGDQRVTAKFPGAEAIEVGSLYAQFIQQLVGWLLYQERD
jgi:uncharacterized membrane protein